MTIGLGIDAGGTALRWCLAARGGGLIARGDLPPVTGHIFTEEARQRAGAIIDALRGAVLTHGKPARVLAGITGLDAKSESADIYRRLLAHAFDLPLHDVDVDTDMVVAYRAAFTPGDGILIYSGTGSVGFHLAADGSHVRAGGRGVIIDDGGSGFWIAKEAVKALFRMEDRGPGNGFATVLGRHLAEGFGAATWDAARTYIYGGERGRVAGLVPHVASAARDGDPVALAIFEGAGRELADLADSLFARTSARHVVLTGGASFAHPALAEAFRDALAGRASIEHRVLDPAFAAATIAAH